MANQEGLNEPRGFSRTEGVGTQPLGKAGANGLYKCGREQRCEQEAEGSKSHTGGMTPGNKPFTQNLGISQLIQYFLFLNSKSQS